MAVKVVKEYYVKNKLKIIAQFNKFLHISEDIMLKYFKESELETIFNQMRQEYENILPEIPYIGGKKNTFTSMLIDSVAMLAIFRTLENKSLSYREIGEFNYEFWEKINKIRVRKLVKTGQNPVDQYFNDAYLAFSKKLAKVSQRTKYPEDYVLEFVEGDGEMFDYGFNINECAIHNAFKKLGGENYTPFICLTDFAQANIYGFGFLRTQILGNGAPICDHRFLQKGITPRAWPPDNLQEFKMKLE